MDARESFLSALQTAVGELGLELESAQLERMWRHFGLLTLANRRINLTSIADPVQAAVRHYADSLAVAAWCGSTQRRPAAVLDVGTGGGFPALPLAMAMPDWRFTAIDGTGKKVRCVQQFVHELRLGNCRVLHQRAEDWTSDAGSDAHDDTRRFDLVLFRAIDPIRECLRLARHLCNPGSVVVCYKADPLGQTPTERQSLRPLQFLLAIADLVCQRRPTDAVHLGHQDRSFQPAAQFRGVV